MSKYSATVKEKLGEVRRLGREIEGAFKDASNCCTNARKTDGHIAVAANEVAKAAFSPEQMVQQAAKLNQLIESRRTMQEAIDALPYKGEELGRKVAWLADEALKACNTLLKMAESFEAMQGQ